MAMKFLQIMLDPNPTTPLTPESGEVSILSGDLSGIDDGAVAFADVTLQGLGPNKTRATLKLVTPGFGIASGLIDHAITDIGPGEFVRIHLSGAAALHSGSASYEVFVSVAEGDATVHGVDNNEAPMTKLVIFGGFANGA